MIYNITKYIALIFFKIFFKFKIYGEKLLDDKSPIIICSNHRSLFDPFIIAATLENKLRFMGKIELFKYKLVAAYIKKLGVFPVDREKNPLPAIKNALVILNNNGILGIFPEGTRVTDPLNNSSKNGIAYLAIKGKALVIPIYIESTYKIFQPINVYIGKGIRYSEYYDKRVDSSIYEQVSNDIMERIYNQKKFFV